MARNDDDDDAVSESPRPKRRQASEDEDDRPRKKSGAEVEEARAVSMDRPMPVRLAGAIIAAMAWGMLMLYFSCVGFSNVAFFEVQRQKVQIDHRIDIGDGSTGMRYTQIATKFFYLLGSATLLAGGITLLLRKSFGKFIALGGAVAMAGVEVLAFVVCLIISKGTFLTHYNVEFFLNIVFSLAVGGCIAFLVMNKEVARALK